MHFYDEFYGARLFMHLVIFKSKLIVLGFKLAIKGSTASEKYISRLKRSDRNGKSFETADRILVEFRNERYDTVGILKIEKCRT